ncbi:MAG: Eco57I restriction-modification methylase domain-containing protein, partial [Planctomycetes bacterium]|nr:Eco57I restriction-modification methylase domain-containing protein [Planctomycetota bacterium]
MNVHVRNLGLKLKGEQLAAGVRFVRLVREGAYDLVVANPPYQGTSKMVDSRYIEQQYPLGKADLYASFLLRGLELVRDGGVSAMLTMRNWMFIKQYSGLREWLLEQFSLRALGDFDRGAFEDVPDEVVSVAVSAFAKMANQADSVALLPTPREDKSRDSERTQRKRAATLCHVGRHEFDPAALKAVPEWPLVYWWSVTALEAYQSAPLLGDIAPAK